MAAFKEYTGSGKTPGAITFGELDSPEQLVGAVPPTWYDDGGNIVIDFNSIAGAAGSSIIRDSIIGVSKFIQLTFDFKLKGLFPGAVELTTLRATSSAKIGGLLINPTGGNNRIRPRGGADAAIAGWTTDTVLAQDIWYRVQIAEEVATTTTGKFKAKLIRVSDLVELASGESTNLNNGTADTRFHQTGKASSTLAAPIYIDNVAFEGSAYEFLPSPTIPAPVVNSISNRTFKSFETVTTKAIMASGTPDTWVFTQVSGEPVTLSSVGDTCTFLTPPSFAGTTVGISIVASEGSNASQPLVFNVLVKPHQHWYKKGPDWVPRIGTFFN